MVFEYDPNRSQPNLKNHDIDFDEAQTIWNDENSLEIPARTLDEARFLVIGIIESEYSPQQATGHPGTNPEIVFPISKY
jgi:uncharacterized protein